MLNQAHVEIRLICSLDDAAKVVEAVRCLGIAPTGDAPRPAAPPEATSGQRRKPFQQKGVSIPHGARLGYDILDKETGEVRQIRAVIDDGAILYEGQRCTATNQWGVAVQKKYGLTYVPSGWDRAWAVYPDGTRVERLRDLNPIQYRRKRTSGIDE